MVESDAVLISLSKPVKDLTGKGGVDRELVFVVKDVEEHGPYIGSVSIKTSTILEGELNRAYRMWFTLFDSQDDDEYDGAMGLVDDEVPRILMELTI